MSKGFAVYPLTRQPVENVINEQLIRECIFIAPLVASEEERLRVVGNRDEVVLRQKTEKEIRSMPLYNVQTLIMSFRRLRKIDNLYGLGGLTKLCLDNNCITKMENLNHLTSLTWLDLSFNAIEVIEGIDELSNLQNLSLYSNKISKLSGLNNLHKLSALSIGQNPLDNLDDVTRYLHKIKSLRVLTLRSTPLESMPHYRVRVLAFIPTLTFLNGHAVHPDEIAHAREDQRENLLPIDEEDERELTEARANAEAEHAREEYEKYNCPNETKLCEELNQLAPDGRNVMSVIRSDLVIAASKETIDRFQNEFNEAAKELTESMRNIRIRRDKDDEAYHIALKEYNALNSEQSRKLIHAFEEKLKMYIPKEITIALTQSVPLNTDTAAELHSDLQSLQGALIELEAQQFNAFEAMHNGTLNKWKSDGVDVLLQGAFENFFKLESDFQTNLRHAFDALFEQRQRRERSVDDFYFSSKQDESVVAIVDNKEEYQKLLNDWSEMRRKYLESLEMQHLKNEEELLAHRANVIANDEQERHRVRLVEISSYVDRMSDYIDAACDDEQG